MSWQSIIVRVVVVVSKVVRWLSWQVYRLADWLVSKYDVR